MGKLIVCEGIDGCGKSTQIKYLKDWLEERGEKVVISEYFSGKYSKKILGVASKSKYAGAHLGATAIAIDFGWRYENIILPALNEGKTVICDRYIYTSLTRDVVRGVDEEYIRKLYKFAPIPDIVLYFHLAPQIACERKQRLKDDASYFSFFEAGLDIYTPLSIPEALSRFESNYFTKEDIADSFIKFQQRVIDQYHALGEFNKFIKINCELSIDDIHQLIVDEISKLIN